MKSYNRNFGKLDEGGNILYAPVPLPVDGNVWTNSPEIHLKCGYYPVVRTDNAGREGYYYSSYFEFEDGVILQKWTEHEIPPEEMPVETVTEAELQAAIREGVNSIDS